jgi:hypothetical protein
LFRETALTTGTNGTKKPVWNSMEQVEQAEQQKRSTSFFGAPEVHFIIQHSLFGVRYFLIIPILPHPHKK